MRHMIAELNYGFKPHLVVMDGVDIFVDGGPMTGKPAKPGIIVVGTDRIAIDAVGLAVLKNHGANDAIMSKKIFEQEQLARAVELGLGVKSRRPDRDRHRRRGEQQLRRQAAPDPGAGLAEARSERDLEGQRSEGTERLIEISPSTPDPQFFGPATASRHFCRRDRLPCK